jgi:hypothetical protein
LFVTAIPTHIPDNSQEPKHDSAHRAILHILP